MTVAVACVIISSVGLALGAMSYIATILVRQNVRLSRLAAARSVTEAARAEAIERAEPRPEPRPEPQPLDPRVMP